jgi:hypothetical protein
MHPRTAGVVSCMLASHPAQHKHIHALASGLLLPTTRRLRGRPCMQPGTGRAHISTSKQYSLAQMRPCALSSEWNACSKRRLHGSHACSQTFWQLPLTFLFFVFMGRRHQLFIACWEIPRASCMCSTRPSRQCPADTKGSGNPKSSGHPPPAPPGCAR